MRALSLLAAILSVAALLLWLQGRRGESLDHSVARPSAVDEPPSSTSAVDVVPRERRAAPGAPENAEPQEPSATREPRSNSARPGRTRRLAGLVLDHGTTTPLPGFDLVVEDRQKRDVLQRVTTDDSGRFTTAELPYGTVVVRHDTAPADRGVARWILPSSVALVPGDAPLELTFEARAPRWIFEVDVVEADSAPAADASVHLGVLQRDPQTGRDMFTGGSARTDAQGRARVGLWVDEGLSGATVFAVRGTDEVSTLLELGDPTEVGVPRLVLGAPARIELEVSWSFGGAAAEHGVRVRGPAPWWSGGDFALKTGTVTDAAGRCSIGPLLPGEHTVVVDNPRRGGQEVVAEGLELAAGETRHVVVALSDGGRALAASGRVVDEADEPLVGVDVVGLLGGPWPEEVETDADGRFEIWARPADDVRVVLDHDTEGDVYEPGEALVPFGTKDLVFRRAAVAAERSFRIVAVDEVSGATIEGVVAAFYRGAGKESWSNAYAPRELYERRVQPGLLCRVGAEGYVSAIVDLSAELPGPEDDPSTVRIALRPGLSHVAVVLDMQTDEPIEGALFRGEGVPDVRTDAEGRAIIDADRWVTYQVTHPDFVDDEWDPTDHVLFVWGPLHLDAKD